MAYWNVLDHIEYHFDLCRLRQVLVESRRRHSFPRRFIIPASEGGNEYARQMRDPAQRGRYLIPVHFRHA